MNNPRLNLAWLGMSLAWLGLRLGWAIQINKEGIWTKFGQFLNFRTDKCCHYTLYANAALVNIRVVIVGKSQSCSMMPLKWGVGECLSRWMMGLMVVVSIHGYLSCFIFRLVGVGVNVIGECQYWWMTLCKLCWWIQSWTDISSLQNSTRYLS